MANKSLFGMIITIALALIMLVTPGMVEVNGAGQVLRTTTVEVERQTVDYQSILDEFEDGELETKGTLTTFTGYKTINVDEIGGYDYVNETNIDDLTGCKVYYKFTYDFETNVVTMYAFMQNEYGELEMEEISGFAFINGKGDFDAMLNVDGEYICLSVLQDVGKIQNCGLFSKIFKAVVAVVAVSAVVAVVVATAGAGMVAVVAAAAGAGAVAGGVAGGLISYSEYGKLDWRWVVGGAVIGAALGAATGYGVGHAMGVGTSQTTQVNNLIKSADNGSLKFSKTVEGYYTSGQRPYCNSKLLVKEIMQAKTPIPDPQGTSALKWIVEGVKDGSKGAWELIVDPNTQTIWHLLWISM